MYAWKVEKCFYSNAKVNLLISAAFIFVTIKACVHIIMFLCILCLKDSIIVSIKLKNKIIYLRSLTTLYIYYTLYVNIELNLNLTQLYCFLVVWHHSLLLMNSFNKTEAAVFSCRLCFLRAFPFISLL